MPKRRTKRPYETSKRCDCRDQNSCAHPWWLRVKVRGEKRQRINLTARYQLAVPMTREDIAVWAARAKNEARKGLLAPVLPGETRITFGRVADRYAEARGKKQYYLDGVRALSIGGVRFENKPVDDITPADIKEVVALWKKRPRAGAVAIRHVLQTLRHAFNWSIAEGYATRTPFRSLQGVPIIHIKASKGRSRRLEEGESERILAAADPYIADFFTAMVETGCRPGELRMLQWSEVRPDHFVIVPEKAKDREERKIPIMPTLRKIFDRRKIGLDGSELGPDRYVFGNEVGDMLGRRRLCALWLVTCKRAKVTNLHLHDLRAEAGSQLLEAGVPIHQVRDALGHSSTTMTSTYLRSRTDSLEGAFKRRHAYQARKAMRLAHVGQSGARRRLR